MEDDCWSIEALRDVNSLAASIATGSGLLGDVRFTPGSDRTADIPDQQLRAKIYENCTY